jgi:hypothetical protein
MFHRARLGIAATTLGVGVLMATAAPVAAATAKGSNPNSAFCKETKALEKAAEKSESTPAFAKDIQTGNWPATKKVIMAAFATETKFLKQFSGVINSLPGPVKAAEEVELKQFPSEVKAVQGMTTMAQFNSEVQKLGQTKKDKAAEKVAAAYTIAQCGSPTVPSS